MDGISIMSDSNEKNNGDASADPAHPASENDSCDDCLTERVADDISRCQMKRPWCNYAFSFGFSAFCTHLRHKEFRKNKKGQ
jgi:hypothetical protein